MTPPSDRKEKLARKRYGPRRWIVDWTIEPTSVPGHVSLSLFVTGESDDSVCSSTTRHYLIQQERIADLIRELAGTLEHSHASRTLEEQVAMVSSQVSVEQTARADAAEKDLLELSSHFSLGAYGLVGN
jgi:hypothetical protein